MKDTRYLLPSTLEAIYEGLLNEGHSVRCKRDKRGAIVRLVKLTHLKSGKVVEAEPIYRSSTNPTTTTSR